MKFNSATKDNDKEQTKLSCSRCLQNDLTGYYCSYWVIFFLWFCFNVTMSKSLWCIDKEKQ